MSMALSAALIFSYCILAEKNNRQWKIASRGVSNLRKDVEKTLKGSAADSKIAVLNLPPHYKGAHMLYNASMFGIALRPPLSAENLSKRVIFFAPVTFGDANLINRERFKALLSDRKLASILIWDQDKEKLVEMPSWRQNATQPSPETVDLGGSSAPLTLGKNDAIRSPDIDIASTDFDFVDLELKVELSNNSARKKKPAAIVLYWSGKAHPEFSHERSIALPLEQNGEYNRYRFSVGENKSWLSEGRISGLLIDTTDKTCQVYIKSARAIRAVEEIPSFAPAPPLYARIDQFGIVYPKPDLGPLKYDATMIRNAKSVRYEISAPDSWFEHYSGTFRDRGPSDHISVAGNLEQLKSENWTVDLKDIKTPAYYELRIMALDAAGKALGYVSNPINFQLSSEWFEQRSEKK